jgi:hypothetical protein
MLQVPTGNSAQVKEQVTAADVWVSRWEIGRLAAQLRR